MDRHGPQHVEDQAGNEDDGPSWSGDRGDEGNYYDE
jgi:hypothetical protein